jgi:hypothetical protein
MTSSVPSDSSATGTLQIIDGSQTSEGTVGILTKGSGESLVQLTTPNFTQTLIFANGQANQVVGTTVSVLSLERTQTTQAAEFPLPLLLAIINNSDNSLVYVGLETSTGQSLNHVQSCDTYASQSAMQPLASFSTRDIWFDASSGLPVRVSYLRRDAQGAVASVAVDIFFSNYQAAQGVLYPMTIQESLNGTPWATLSIQSVSFNVGLTDADFPIQ